MKIIIYTAPYSLCRLRVPYHATRVGTALAKLATVEDRWKDVTSVEFYPSITIFDGPVPTVGASFSFRGKNLKRRNKKCNEFVTGGRIGRHDLTAIDHGKRRASGGAWWTLKAKILQCWNWSIVHRGPVRTSIGCHSKCTHVHMYGRANL